MTDLIKRLEEADEGSRELDIAIWEHVGRPQIWPFTGLNPQDWVTSIGGKWIPTTRYGRGGCSGDRICLNYTTSLDAAMTLVPEGYGWCLDYMDPGEPDGAMVGQHTCDATTFGKPITPALALCIAALKAKDQS